MNKTFSLIPIWFLFILFYITNSIASNQVISNLIVWDYSEVPVLTFIDSRHSPTGIANNQSIISNANQWNSNPSFNNFAGGKFFNLYEIDISYSDRATIIDKVENGKNQIIFDLWPENYSALAYTVRHVDLNECNYNTPGFPNDCVKKIKEADIALNPYVDWFDTISVPSNCSSTLEVSAITVLNHELGHLLGLRHQSGESNTMYASTSACTYKDVSDRDFQEMFLIYPSVVNANIDINSPTSGQVLIANQVNTFNASITPLTNNKGYSIDEIKAAEDNLVWTSSVDGVIANGNNVPVSNLSAGEHELTVTVGQPGDAIYGESYTSVYVIDSTTDLVDEYGRTVAYPVPCVRSVDRSDGACLFTFLDSVDVAPVFLDGCGTHPHSYHITFFPPTPYSEDYLPDGTGPKFTMHREPIPWCDASLPTTASQIEYFAFSSWVYDSIMPNSVNYHLFYQLDKIVGVYGIFHQYIHQLPIADPEIYVTTPSDCNVTNVTAKCGVDISWNDKYFLPDSGLLYKPNGTTSWQLVAMLPEDRNGTINTGNIIDVNGGELAVFQYAQDVRTPNTHELLVSGPNGMMAGPFLVKAISSNTPPTDPTLYSVETSCANNYCIEMLGENFGENSYVDIRPDLNGGDILKRIEGNDIYSRSDSRIFFPIQDLTLQNKLNTTGLCFWVVNPPEFSEGICTTRPPTPAQPPFMGSIVESYNPQSGPQDLEYTSYVVAGNNNDKLKIWGNVWKKIAYNYTVTPSTVLEFSFRSTQQEAEINGIGFIMNGSSSMAETKFWKIHGTQNFGNQDYDNYSGTDFITYRIPVGQYFTGQISNMVFAADEDNHVGQMVVFKNPVLLEAPDQYDDVPAQRPYDDDVRERPVSWLGSDTAHYHNFHDSGDADWTIVYMNGTREFRTEMIGANSDTKISVYKWISANYNSADGTFYNVVDQLLGSDTGVGNSSFTYTANQGTTVAVKVESRTGSFGVGTDYKLIIDTP